MALYRVTTFGRMVSNEQWNFTIHLSAVTGQAATLAATAADAVTLLWQGPPTPGSSLQQLYDAGTNVDGVRVDELDNLGHNVSQGAQDLTLLGTGVDEPLPPQVAMVVSLRSDLPTRAGRGRFFLPPPMVSTVVDQRLGATAKSQVLAASKAMLDHYTANDATVVIRHRILRGEPVTDGSFEQVFKIDVGDVFDTQRRRRDQLTEVRSLATLA